MDERTRRYVERLDRSLARPLAEQLEDEVGPYRGLTMQQRARVLEGLCRAAWVVLSTRPDRDAVLRFPEPGAADLETIWRRLMKQREGRRTSHGA